MPLIKEGCLTFDQLRKANVARHGFGENAKCLDWTPAQWLQALVGEVGEYANWRKKYEKGKITKEEFDREAKKEIADIQTYMDLLAYKLGYNLGEITRAKFNEVSDRIGSEIKL